MHSLFLKISLFIFLTSMSTGVLYAQNDTINYGYISSSGDSLIHVDLDEIIITAPFIIKTNRQKRIYNRLTYDLIKAYPLAKIVNKELQTVQDSLKQIPKEIDQKKFVKKYESYVYNTYIDSLKQLNLRQGKLFLTLINRETGESGYDLIKTYRGDFSAAFWQAMARLFGSSLKTYYNPEEEAMIEDILQRIDAGLL